MALVKSSKEANLGSPKITTRRVWGKIQYFETLPSRRTRHIATLTAAEANDKKFAAMMLERGRTGSGRPTK